MLLFGCVQVTNPAIDPLREGLVMSLEVNIGKRRNILEIGPENALQVCLYSPVYLMVNLVALISLLLKLNSFTVFVVETK